MKIAGNKNRAGGRGIIYFALAPGRYSIFLARASFPADPFESLKQLRKFGTAVFPRPASEEWGRVVKFFEVRAGSSRCLCPVQSCARLYLDAFDPLRPRRTVIESSRGCTSLSLLFDVFSRCNNAGPRGTRADFQRLRALRGTIGRLTLRK